MRLTLINQFNKRPNNRRTDDFKFKITSNKNIGLTSKSSKLCTAANPLRLRPLITPFATLMSNIAVDSSTGSDEN